MLREDIAEFIAGIKFNQQGLIPAIVQDYKSKEVLMLAYMNKKSLEITIKEQRTCFWSRSREQLWRKGETSGNIQRVKKIKYDCDQDTLLILAEQKGVACHTGAKSCFYRELDLTENSNVKTSKDNQILTELYAVIQDRKRNLREGSYTSSLFKKGENSFLKKIGEEGAEVVMAAKESDAEQLTYEAADLIYHLFVTLVYYGVELEDLFEELRSRR